MKNQPRNHRRQFKPTLELGELVIGSPAAAHVRLVALFKRHVTRAAVAKALKVPDSTVRRWIVRLEEGGFEDPRTKVKSARQPRRQRSRLALAIERDPNKVRGVLRRLLRRKPGESRHAADVRVARSYKVSEITIRRAVEQLGIVTD